MKYRTHGGIVVTHWEEDGHLQIYVDTLRRKRRCEMLMPENDVKNNVGQCCKLVFKAVCGSSTPGSYRPGCMEEPEDEKLCPKLLPIGC
ncbi:hypothetical protein V5799_004409 [Amblyomma americanum]|uniref:Uncharacterized protein n=1 Tax=Amblyomma americanum TaxID=6943 RepID=A0AAQ4D669_AMBAM